MEKEIRFLDPSIERKGLLLEEHLSSFKQEQAPMFSLLEFNLSGLCNRQCVFCPRVDPDAFPNRNIHMPVGMYEGVLADLEKAGFDGTIIYSAFSEPLLYKDLDKVIRLARERCPKVRTELVTNGDLLTLDRLKELFRSGLTMLAVSMYDGPHQMDHFKALKEKAGLSDAQMILRIRWLSVEEHFGITLSNRAGSVTIKEARIGALPSPARQACHYPFYQILIDYDGAVLLCAHDWGRRLIVGNVNDESTLSIWNNAAMKKVRVSLIKEDRGFRPCDRCDVHGVLIGRNYFEKWTEYYEK
jgi:radical SAM protein with 4Fe4S-binding SPASM domain